MPKLANPTEKFHQFHVCARRRWSLLKAKYFAPKPIPQYDPVPDLLTFVSLHRDKYCYVIVDTVEQAARVNRFMRYHGIVGRCHFIDDTGWMDSYPNRALISVPVAGRRLVYGQGSVAEQVILGRLRHPDAIAGILL